MIDLRLGDCTDPAFGLPSLGTDAVDATICDPPFDERTHRTALEGPRKPQGARSVTEPLPFPPLTPDAIRALARLLAHVTRRWILVFCAERQISLWADSLEAGGARFVRLGSAYRTNPRPQMTGDRPGQSFDPIVIAHAGKGRMRWNGRGRAARWESPPSRFDPGGQVHPCQKPVRLMRALVEDFTDTGDLVCDPFAGAASTAVACKLTGRRFVGWEVSATYHAAALARLDATHEQLSLLDGGTSP